MQNFNPSSEPEQTIINSVRNIQDQGSNHLVSPFQRISPINLKTDLGPSAGPSSDGATSSSGQISPLSYYSSQGRQPKHVMQGYSKSSSLSRKSSSGARHNLKCPYCNKMFSNSSAIAKHKLTHSDERKYICNICNKAFKRQDHLNGHKLTHESKKPHACQFCDKSYSDARSLKRHYENLHSDELARIKSRSNPQLAGSGGGVAGSSVSHDDSGKKSGAENNSSLLFNPLEEPKLSQCSICQKRFKNQSALNGHMRLHGGYNIRSDNNSPHSNDSFTSEHASRTASEPTAAKPFSSYLPYSQASQAAVAVAVSHPTASSVTLNALDHLLIPFNASPNISPLRCGLSSNVSPNTTLDPALVQQSPFNHEMMDLDFTPCHSQHMDLQKENSQGGLASSGRHAVISQYSLLNTTDYHHTAPTGKSLELNSTFIHQDPTLTDLNAGMVSYRASQQQQQQASSQMHCRDQSIAFGGAVKRNIALSNSPHLMFQVDPGGNPAVNRDRLVVREPSQQEQQRQLLNIAQYHHQLNPNYMYLASGSQPSGLPHHPNMVPAASLLQLSSASRLGLNDITKMSTSPSHLTNSILPSTCPPELISLKHEPAGSINGDYKPSVSQTIMELDQSIQDAGGDLFRNPHTPPLTKKLKKKPAPLFIPPQAGINLSRLRSPRYWDPNRIQKQFSPPPYTPPPMLSPVRKGTGLFYSIKRGFSTPSAGNTPITPRLSTSCSGASLSSDLLSLQEEKQQVESQVQDMVTTIKKEQLRSPDFQLIPESAIKKSSTPSPHPSASVKSDCSPQAEEPMMFRYGEEMPQSLSGDEDVETDDGIPTCVMPMINLGLNYQADLPEYCPDLEEAKTDSRVLDDLLWDPVNLEDNDNNSESLKLLMKIASSPAIKDCGLNMEYTFHLLCKFKGNFDETLQALLKEAFVVYDYVYAETTPWTTDEILKFQQSLGTHDRDFYKISQDLKASGCDKSVKGCVEFYYMWKEMNTGTEVNKLRSQGRRSKKDHQQQISPSFVNGAAPCSSNQAMVETAPSELAPASENSFYNLRRKPVDNVTCSSCDMVFPNTRQLESHNCKGNPDSHVSRANTPDSAHDNIYDFEPSEKMFPCKLCNKVFAKVKSRNAHMKSHSDKTKQDQN